MTVGSGRCLCGSVSFTVRKNNEKVDACHCGMCRKWGGGPLMFVSSGPDVEFEGAENITVYNSSEWAERGFCKKCGSHLFYRFKETQDHEMLVGLFDNQNDFEFDLQVFIDKKPSFYNFADKTGEMTEAQMLEEFSSK